MKSQKMSKVTIYGAGLSGLVASINLVREGYDVHVFDCGRKISGIKRWHPSIQTTILNPEQTWDYINIDLSGCFEPVNRISLYRYSNKKVFYLENMYVCERGPRKSSLDSRLYEIALQSGVKFHFDKLFDLDNMTNDENIILATGLNIDVYKYLKIPYTPIYGYKAIRKMECTNELISYMHKCTNYDFAYLAAKNNIQFILLFSRGKISHNNLTEFQEILYNTENIKISKWMHSEGAIPQQKNLFYKNMVLSGTVSGAIDPFVLHGISGALTSGKVAAMAISDREKGQREFNWLTKNHTIKNNLKKISMFLPFKTYTSPLMMWLEAHLRGVGFVK